MFKSVAQREAERLEREAEQARVEAAREERARLEEERRAREAFLATPVGAATAAKEAGHRFFEVQLEVGGHAGTAGFGATEGRRTVASSADTLAQIEEVRWRLEHASCFFMVTGDQHSPCLRQR